MADNPNQAFPESYRRLNEFAARFAADSMVTEHGVVPDRWFLVLSGRVRLEAPDDQGATSAIGEAGRGQLIGHLAALEARPAMTTATTVATTVDDAVLIAIPVDRVAEAFALSPDLAVAVARDLATRAPAEARSEIPAQLPAIELAPEPASNDAEPVAPDLEDPDLEVDDEADAGAATGGTGSTGETGGSIGGGFVQGLTKLSGDFDDSFFFKDGTDCPACDSRFEYLRVRTAGVRPQQRDSDYHVSYQSEDPTRYGVVVCPTCSYAATHDDFATLTEDERAAIVNARQARGRYDYPNLCGPRSLEESLIAIDLAQSCYALRASNERRDAALLHRRAWIERERGDEAAEVEWLTKARDAYRRSFELDSGVSEESAMRVAYLIGDLSLRLDDPILGAQWLETAVRFPQAKQQSGLERQARDRLSDARKLLAELEAEQQSA